MLIPIIEEFVYALEDIELEVAIGRLLKEKGLTVSTAESVQVDI
jgi:nicotinamide-nucleotide amidase